MKGHLQTCQKHSVGAFTLLEMALALGILVLIISMVAASRAGFQEEIAFRNTAAELSRTMHAARAAALQAQSSVTMMLDDNGAEWLPPANDSGQSNSDPDAGDEGGAVALEDGVQWAAWDRDRREWRPVRELAWIFGSDGTVRAPRMRLYRGKSYMDFSVDPLTAELLEEGFELH